MITDIKIHYNDYRLNFISKSSVTTDMRSIVMIEYEMILE
jgi:hypothetical protein